MSRARSPSKAPAHAACSPRPTPGRFRFASSRPDDLAGWLDGQDAATRAWVGAMGFAAKLGEVLCLPGPDGSLRMALAGWGTEAARRRDRFPLAAAAAKLPAGRYALAPGGRRDRRRARGARLAPRRLPLRPLPGGNARRGRARLSGRGRRRAGGADRRRRGAGPGSRSTPPPATWGRRRSRPPSSPSASGTGRAVAVTRGAAALRAANLPMIEAVGAAAAEPPRLLDLVWGREDAPKVTLVGKGVCFDTGGLDIKPPASMGLMKKDMGGAATAMGLADMVMGLGLDLRLRLLVPAVENAISGRGDAPGRHPAEPQGADRRGQQHRRRGPPGARRRAGARRRGGARPRRQPRHPDRRRPGGARAGRAALLHRRRRAGGGPRRRLRFGSPTRSGGCPSGTPTSP